MNLPMRRPSRLLPPYEPPPPCLGAGLVFALLAGGLVWAMAHATPGSLAVVVLVFAGLILLGKRMQRRVRRHREARSLARSPASICAFARQFDCRAVDTWVIRAVYEALQKELASNGTPAFALSAADRLVDDLRFDVEDLECSVMPVIAARTGRTLDDTHANPYWDKVATAGDFVQFFNAQPLRAASQ